MDTKKKLLVTTSLLASFVLSACAGTEPNSKWNYTEEEIKEAIELEFEITGTEGNNITACLATPYQIVNEGIGTGDILVLDVASIAAAKESTEDGKGFLGYGEIQKYATTPTAVSLSEEGTELTVTFDKGNASEWGLFINKAATIKGNHILAAQYFQDAAAPAIDSQLQMEEKYVSQKFNWDNGGEFIVDLLVSYGSIIVGAANKSPTAVYSGITSFYKTIANKAFKHAPTIADVLAAIAKLDAKIDRLSKQLDANTKQLLDASIQISNGVDKAILEVEETQISQFESNVINDKVEAFYNKFNKMLDKGLKDIVNSASYAIDVFLKKDSNGEWDMLTNFSKNDAQETITVNFASFANSLADLSRTNNIVKESFSSALESDITAAVANLTLPEGLSRERFVGFVKNTFADKIIKEYYSAHEEEAVEAQNLATLFAKDITGGSVKCVVDYYLGRLSYMYNFASETKEAFRLVLSRLLKILDALTYFAATASNYAAINSDAMETAYKAARDYISDTYTSYKETADNYCFTVGKAVNFNVFNSYARVSYSNKGNHCRLNSEIVLSVLKEEEGRPNGGMRFEKIENINSIDFLSEFDHARIASRMNSLSAIGAVKSTRYYDYLIEANIISNATLETIETCKRTGFLSKDVMRFATSLQVRDLDDRDKGEQYVCRDVGNPKGNFFRVGQDYTWGNTSHWWGKVLEGKMVDANTGKGSGNANLASWCRYAESHWYWRQDEYWGFTNSMPYDPISFMALTTAL